MPSDIITKTTFIKGRQCKKHLWLNKHMPDDLTPDNPIKEFMFKQGILVGNIAKQRFPNGKEIPADLPFDKKLALTKQLIKKKTPIFEASFHWNQCFCITDILQYNNGTWDIIEVKSSTSVKRSHIKDLAFQTYLLTQLKIPIGQCYIMHINTAYHRVNTLDLDQLFSTVNVTPSVIKKLPKIEQSISEYKLTLSLKTTPNIPIGTYCFSPYQCPAFSLCWKNIPEKSVFNINSLSLKKKLDFYNHSKINIADLAAPQLENYKQKIQLSCEKEGLDFINKKNILSFLSKIKSPISFLDIEACQFAIPPFPNTIPYQQIPFQYSLHIKNKSTLTHREFIGDGQHDPRPSFIASLLSHLPKRGSILVFNADFEKNTLLDFVQIQPKLAKKIEDIIHRFIDIALPFQDYDIYLRAMNGKQSLKGILPALVPELSYLDLDINTGLDANINYHELINNPSKTNIINQLKQYCQLDTYALVRILDCLKTLTNSHVIKYQ